MDSRENSNNSNAEEVQSVPGVSEPESTTLALPNAEFGKGLLVAAHESKMNQAREFLVTEAINIQKFLEEAEAGILICTKQKKHYESVLKAIEAGQFNVTRNGNIRFHDSKLSLGRYVVPGQIRNSGFEPDVFDAEENPE